MEYVEGPVLQLLQFWNQQNPQFQFKVPLSRSTEVKLEQLEQQQREKLQKLQQEHSALLTEKQRLEEKVESQIASKEGEIKVLQKNVEKYEEEKQQSSKLLRKAEEQLQEREKVWNTEKQQLQSEITSQQTYLKELQTQVAQNKQNIQSLNDEKVALQTTVTKQQQEFEVLQERENEWITEKKLLQQNIQSLKDEKVALVNTLTKEQKELKRAHQRVEAVRAELGANKQLIEKLNEDITQLRRSLDSTHRERDVWKQKFDNIELKLDQAQKQLSQLQATQEATKAEATEAQTKTIQVLRKSLDEQKGQVTNLTTANVQLNEEIKQLSRTLESKETQIAKTIREVEEAKAAQVRREQEYKQELERAEKQITERLNKLCQSKLQETTKALENECSQGKEAQAETFNKERRVLDKKVKTAVANNVKCKETRKQYKEENEKFRKDLYAALQDKTVLYERNADLTSENQKMPIYQTLLVLYVYMENLLLFFLENPDGFVVLRYFFNFFPSTKAALQEAKSEISIQPQIIDALSADIRNTLKECKQHQPKEKLKVIYIGPVAEKVFRAINAATQRLTELRRVFLLYQEAIVQTNCFGDILTDVHDQINKDRKTPFTETELKQMEANYGVSAQRIHELLDKFPDTDAEKEVIDHFLNNPLLQHRGTPEERINELKQWNKKWWKLLSPKDRQTLAKRCPSLLEDSP